MHLYSKNLSTAATISFPNISKFLLACFFCSNYFNLSISSLGSDGNRLVIDFLKERAMMAGDLSNFLRDFSVVFFHLKLFHQKTFLLPFAKSYINYLPCNLSRSTPKFSFAFICKRNPSNSNFLSVPRNANKLLYRVTGIVLFITKLFTLFELGSFTSFYWLVCSGLVIFNRGDKNRMIVFPPLIQYF